MALSDYETVIGLEVHAQLATKSKLFSTASTEFGASPNSHTTSVCLGMPGALPVPNQLAVRLALRAGLALGCTINTTSTWARKHYFYPDLPKGYQISQYERPLCEGGRVPLERARTVPLRRIHLEEDAGRSTHDAEPGLTLIDLNRAGTPLIEIVSEPELRSADEAVDFFKSLRDILVALHVNDGNLEEGNLRCDANVSLRRKGETKLGTRCELKNLNSFRFLKDAIGFEVRRQAELLDEGKTIEQQTRLFDPKQGETRAMRSKEDADDYRYFPDPDLPPLVIDDATMETERSSMPELPHAKRHRYESALSLSPAEAASLTGEPALAAFFDECVRLGAAPRRTATLLLGEVARLVNAGSIQWSALPFTPAAVAQVASAVEAGTLSFGDAREIIEALATKPGDVAALIAAKSSGPRAEDGEIDAVVEAVLRAEPKSVAAYRAGNPKLLGFLVGQAMKALKGKADPKRVSERLTKALAKPAT